MKKTTTNPMTTGNLNYYWRCFCRGLRALAGQPWRRAAAVLYWMIILAVVVHTAIAPAANFFDKLLRPLVCIAVPIGAATVFLIVVTISAIPRGAWQAAQAFQRIGLSNHAGETPRLIDNKNMGDGKMMKEFFTQGITVEDFQDKIPEIESALNVRVTKIEAGCDQQHIILHLAPGNAKIPDVVDRPRNIESAPSRVWLGQSLDGPVVVDFNKTPHILVGGSTGSGKTYLLKGIMQQCLQRDHDVYLIDLKGGQDYPPIWRKFYADYSIERQDALSVCSRIVADLERRKVLFNLMAQEKNRPCSTIDDYNAMIGCQYLTRKILFIDEIAELTDTTGLDKNWKELANTTINKLSTIARLGRAFGINLVVGTQRPDATVIPGQIKNNIDVRLCGKADNTLSIIILDNGDAAEKIPKDSQGLFLNQDGVLFRAYRFVE